MGTMKPIEQKFYQENKITLKEAIDKINTKKNESIDYEFLVSMLDDEYYKTIAIQQVESIQNEIKNLLMVRDNFDERMILKAIKEVWTHKKESDDTRMARKVLDKEKLLASILEWPYKFNPLLELNPWAFPNKYYPVIYDTKKEFRKINSEHLFVEYYPSWKNIKSVNVLRWHEWYMITNRELIEDIDLRQYPFYIRRQIQNANWTMISL